MRILQRNLKRTYLIVQEMWRHHNMCWKWPSFASRQDWTRRAVFWKVLASTSAVTAWVSSVMFAFKASVVRGLFGKLSLSDIPIRNNQAPLAKWQRDQQRGESGRKQAGWLADRCSVSQQLGALQTHTTDTFLFIYHTTNVLLFKFRCSIFIDVRIIKEMSGSIASGTHCIMRSDSRSVRPDIGSVQLKDKIYPQKFPPPKKK